MSHTIDAATFRSVLGRFASGVTVVTAVDGAGTPHGMTATAFCSVSLSPPLVLVCVDLAADLRPVLERAEHFGVNILTDAQETLSRRFADPDADRFGGAGFTRGVGGVPVLDDALASIECRIVARHPAGDHVVMLGEILEATVRDGNPLIYYRGGYTQLGG